MLNVRLKKIGLSLNLIFFPWSSSQMEEGYNVNNRDQRPDNKIQWKQIFSNLNFEISL